MKKILAIALCVVLCFCMAVPAFAAGTPEAEYQGQNGQQDVNISINGDIIHVYFVDIEFTNPTFTYSSGSKWNPDTYQYVPSESATWTGTGIVKITNHSDLPVNYTVEKANVVNTYGPLDIHVENPTGTIEKCEVGMKRGDKNATATYKVTGTPTVSEINAQKLGEIKVTISK
ncbi:MAG: hypothetical protein SOZ51_00730 [Eubacteriales bacterium]|nr:hypothetical protein [Eubacteriales bacterium]